MEEIRTTDSVKAPEAMQMTMVQPIGAEQIKKFTQILQQYHAGKAHTETRIRDSENWWKLRNTREEQKNTNVGADGGFTSVSGWLHNVLVSKHADAMAAYPEPFVLPREVGDRAEARMLSAIIPCILEQNNFEATYSDCAWQKVKTGTGVYKVVWDQNKLNGLGDISVERVNLLNIYWEPGITDIQRSRYIFQTELCDKDILEERYPQLKGKLKGQTFMSTKFSYDDHVNDENKHTVVEVYYHKFVSGKKTLQYCKFVGDQVLFATENEPELAERGLYDHGKFPYVFDSLFPIEGSPCGYGYVDICRNPQTEIDILKTSFVKNAMVGATPRYFSRGDGSVNEEEFLDLSKPIVHVNNPNEDALRRIEHDRLDGTYVNVLDRTIQELRETSGNTETSTGNISSGVTAASAIAALQEASGKGSRDSSETTYRAYSLIVEMCIELIRQFYSLPRQFRIMGKHGAEQFISYTNDGIQPQHQGMDFGSDMGFRLPVFDIKIRAAKRSAYSRVAQNELAIQLFQLGVFNPQMVDQALMCLDMMDFEGKEEVVQQISRNGTIFQRLIQYMQLSLTLAAKAAPDMVQGLSQDIMQTMGAGTQMAMGARPMSIQQNNEPANVEKARSRSNQASQPKADN